MIQLLVLIFAVSFAQTSPHRAEFCSVERGPVVEVLFKKKANCDFSEAVSRTLSEVSLNVRKGPSLSVIVSDRGTNASFDNGQIIWIPQVLFSIDARTRIVESTQDELLTVVVHEYAHAIFNEILKSAFTDELGEIYSELGSLSHDSLENFRNRISSRAFNARGQRLAHTPEFERYVKHIPPYSELYADFLAVLYRDSLSAMFEAMRFSAEVPGKKEFVILRDFSKDHTVKDIEASLDPHTELSQVRSFLGQKILTTSLSERKRLLGAVEISLLQAIRENMKAEKMPSVENKNKRLIELIEQNF